MNLLFPFLHKIAGLYLTQRILIKIVYFSQYLMGIGSGAKVDKSGERNIFKVLKEKIKGPYTIFDVGANKGQFLKMTLSEIGELLSTIHSFEPGKKAYDIINLNFKFSNIVLNNIGLGIKNEDRILYYNEEGSSLASLTQRKLDHFGIDFNKEEKVTIRTLDYYCKKNNIKHINLLKVDVEGHELDVFAGAKNMFSNNAIDMVTFEFGGCNIDTRTYFQYFWYFFQDQQMNIYRLTPSGYLFRLDSYSEMYEQFRTTNYLAMRNNI